MTFEEYWKKAGYFHDQTYRGPAQRAWNHQQATINKLESQLEVAYANVDHWRSQCQQLADS